MIICFIVIFKLWINTKAIRNWQPFLVSVFRAILETNFGAKTELRDGQTGFLTGMETISASIHKAMFIWKHSKSFDDQWYNIALFRFFPPFSSLLFFKGFFLLFSRLSLLYVYYKYFCAIFDIFIFLRPKKHNLDVQSRLLFSFLSFRYVVAYLPPFYAKTNNGYSFRNNKFPLF